MKLGEKGAANTRTITVLTGFEVNIGIIIEKYAKTWSLPMC